jgi:hypothetical protein
MRVLLGRRAPLLRIFMKHGIWALVLACVTSVCAVSGWKLARIVKIDETVK